MISRRALLAGLAGVACGGETDVPYQTGIPPWHTWGSNQKLSFEGTTKPQPPTSPQLAAIDYKRPDTWTFLLSCQLTGVGGTPPVNAVAIDFALTIGHGRGSIIIPTFARFEYTVAQMTALLGTTRFLTTVEQPKENLSRVTDNLVETITAQTIQCVATVTFEGSNFGTLFEFDVGAFFSPRTHIRPEWNRVPPRFHGGEG